MSTTSDHFPLTQGRNTCAGSDKPIRGHYVIRTPYNQVRLVYGLSTEMDAIIEGAPYNQVSLIVRKIR